MAESETQYQPLVGAPSQQTAINVPAQGGRPSRAYKVAGLTLLACVLIAGQAMIAYFLLSQGSDIKSLEEQNNNLQAQLTKGRPVSVPMRMHMPINALSDWVDVSADQDASEKPAPPKATECQLEASGLKTLPVPNFRPVCDEHGLYSPQQCFMDKCWCVNPASGQEIRGSMRRGGASCSGNMLIGGYSEMLSLPDVEN
uniref:CD74 molecule, major histocompatibility complex, class II invariant chain b n=1 Tax=Semicossyphus pulcher TaxID=241346 RepID=UPI0037E82008